MGEAIGAGGARTTATPSAATGIGFGAGRSLGSSRTTGTGLVSREATGTGIARMLVPEFTATGTGSDLGRGSNGLKILFATGNTQPVGRGFILQSRAIVSKAVAKPSQ